MRLASMRERLKRLFCGCERERISNIAFRIMAVLLGFRDIFLPADKRIETFGIMEGFTVIDYGCGPGVYLRGVSRLVGETGRVYAIDIHKLAMEAVKKRAHKYGLKNVEPVLASGCSCNLDDHIADVIYALDMFHIVETPGAFLKELHRLLRKEGYLIIDDGHQSREITRTKINDSGVWNIVEEHKHRLKCTPIHEQ